LRQRGVFKEQNMSKDDNIYFTYQSSIPDYISIIIMSKGIAHVAVIVASGAFQGFQYCCLSLSFVSFCT